MAHVDNEQRHPDMANSETAIRFLGYYEPDAVGVQPDSEEQKTPATLTEEQLTTFPDQLRKLAEAIQFDSLFAAALFKKYAEALENSTSPESNQEILQETAELYRTVLEATPDVTALELLNKIAGIQGHKTKIIDEE